MSVVEAEGAVEERVVELEIKVAYQEKALGELNQVVLEQQQQIERLEKHLAMLKQQMAAEGEASAPADEPPPHY